MNVIYFNENNPDSVLGAHILRDMYADNDAEREIKLLTYSRFDKFAPINCDLCVVVGASLRPEELRAQGGVSGDILVYSYNQQENDIEGITYYHPYQHGSDVETVFDKSLSKRIILVNNMHEKYGKLADVVFKYTNFIKMSKDELELFFNTRDSIFDSCAKPFSELKTGSEKLADISCLKVVRKLITRNLEKHLFGDSSKNKFIPTVNVSQDYIYDAARQIQHAHESMVLYEDIKNWRQWIIYSKDAKLAAEFVSMIPHEEKWIDNNFIYLISNQVKFCK